MKIGRIYRFHSAHHLPNHKGKCARPHGHSYVLEVEVEAPTLIPLGPSVSDGGMVMDFYDLDILVKPLLEKLDHEDLNLVTPAFLGIERTTAELLCDGIARYLESGLRNLPYWGRGQRVDLSRVRLWETDRNYAEWTPR